jgi:signal peptidase
VGLNTALESSAKPRKPAADFKPILIVGLAAVLLLGGWLGLIQTLGTPTPVMVVEGRSMLPTLRNGDLVIVKEVPPSELMEEFEAGGNSPIIVYYSSHDRKYIVHRIVGLEYSEEGVFLGFKTKGDHNAVPDRGVVDPEAVVGKVIAHIPSLGLAVIFLRSPPGIVFTVTLLIALAFWSILEGRSKKAGEA